LATKASSLLSLLGGYGNNDCGNSSLMVQYFKDFCQKMKVFPEFFISFEMA
jgi:hypothetical protein